MKMNNILCYRVTLAFARGPCGAQEAEEADCLEADRSSHNVTACVHGRTVRRARCEIGEMCDGVMAHVG